MGSFNIESGENALTPRLNIGDRSIVRSSCQDQEKERERKNGEKAKDSKE